MKDKDIYIVDLETKELLVATMNFIEMFADAQVDQETEFEIRQINRELGDKFGLKREEVLTEEGVDADGNPTITFKQNSEQDNETPPNAKAKRHLRLVEPVKHSLSLDADNETP
jgi:hypothetical protein